MTRDREEGVKVENHRMGVMGSRVNQMEDDTNKAVEPVGKTLAVSQKMEQGRDH